MFKICLTNCNGNSSFIFNQRVDNNEILDRQYDFESKFKVIYT